VKKYPLLNLKGGTDKQVEPLLPIISDSPNALADSPLAPLAAQAKQSNEDEDDAVASLLNPHGPWFLESTLQVPDCQSHIRFSTKHAKTNMAIAHWLKVVIRVERGDDKAIDSKGRRKQVGG
jgi:arrestin-related trafficking adapter 3/6